MDKQILLIAPEFFNYYKLIQAELERTGWKVTYLVDRPPCNALVKIGIRKFRWLFNGYLNRYFQKNLKKLGRFDQVLIVKGEGITSSTIRSLRQKCSGRIQLYLWDGVRNSPGALDLSKVVDHTSTFDSVDAKSYGWQLLPLFYVKSAIHELPHQEFKFDCSFVGSDHGDRMKVIAKVRKQIGGRFFAFVYFPSKIIFYYRKFFDSSFHEYGSSELSLKSIPKAQAEEIFKSSRAVLDIHHVAQNGLTMRTIESLALGKKLITTNATIKDYPFYSEQDVCVVDRKTPSVRPEFFASEPTESLRVKMQAYEIREWVRRLVGESA
ncbi:hypothetical protein [Bdellovibrio sp. HCB209]|uniref:hypothetical protein n=1 Tax=Bdellovibrio sp. HCB209 TaxID=3394354 RepID=UPI0039B6CE5A